MSTITMRTTSDVVKDLYERWSAAFAAEPDMPLDRWRALIEEWPQITAEPGGVDYVEVNAGDVPGMWITPKGAARDRVLAGMFLGESGDPHDPYVNPLYGNLAGLPAMFLQVSDVETPLDDSCSFTEQARVAGVEVRLDVFPSQQHTFQMAAGRSPIADDAIRRLADWVRPHLGL
jgi:acetyl esterase/lipase